MRFRLVALLLLALSMSATAAPGTAIVGNQTDLAVYVPATELDYHYYLSASRVWVEPGRALESALEQGKQVFPRLAIVRDETPAPSFGLLLVLHPEWTVKDGTLSLKMPYRVLSPSGAKLREGDANRETRFRFAQFNADAATLAAASVQQVLSETLQALQPDPSKYPATGQLAALDPMAIVDHAKPLRTGTAVFVGPNQLLASAHIVRGCPLLEAQRNGEGFRMKLRAKSDVLDVAALDSARGQPGQGLPLRPGQSFGMGEGITALGYPLKGEVGDGPRIVRGNVSAQSGVKGSLGMFQVTELSDTGNGGGPIVSDAGELLGLSVGTADSQAFVKRGDLPANSHLVLDARYLAMFMKREGIPFEESRPGTASGLERANQAALASSVQLNCYQ